MNLKKIKLRDFEIGSDKLTVLAGPCVIETYDVLAKTAEGLKKSLCESRVNSIFASTPSRAIKMTHLFKFQSKRIKVLII